MWAEKSGRLPLFFLSGKETRHIRNATWIPPVVNHSVDDIFSISVTHIMVSIPIHTQNVDVANALMVH